ncbi:PTS sugar transporter subunit IIA [Clostridium sp. YIM B02551]|uniref:PTS sugar transporter subunit IIA n=1 Tax=Clostridium sp. YIM B02551 TaxID=2910679 RepID=UPI001EEC0FA8|nr:PTS sugar transporter subunit IIA [Clostridium sp. YIM B02551]
MIVDERLIELELNVKDKNEAINKLAEMAAKANKISSVDEFVKSVLMREEEFSTGVGNGIAIPHGKSKAVNEAMIVLGICKNFIEWDSLDGDPVKIIFMLGVPEENANNIHLKILSNLSRKLMDEDFVRRLKESKTIKSVLEILNEIEIKNI